MTLKKRAGYFLLTQNFWQKGQKGKSFLALEPVDVLDGGDEVEQPLGSVAHVVHGAEEQQGTDTNHDRRRGHNFASQVADHALPTLRFDGVDSLDGVGVLGAGHHGQRWSGRDNQRLLRRNDRAQAQLQLFHGISVLDAWGCEECDRLRSASFGVGLHHRIALG